MAEEKEKKIGEKGVMAKIGAIKAQARENERAVANMDTGTKEIIASTEEMSARMRKEAKNLVARGVRELRVGVQEIKKGIEEVNASIKAKAKEVDTYVDDFYYG